MSVASWREDPLLGNTVDGVCPVGSPEAWAAVLRVRRLLYGSGVTTERVAVTRPAPKPAEPDLVRCACGALYRPWSNRHVRCAPCDGEITARLSAERAKFWRNQERQRA